MNEEKILKIIKRFAKKLPKFADGRIDYSTSETAPVITVFVKYKNKILLLKRSDKVLTYKGKWNTVAGYLDDMKPIKEKALEELSEEIGVKKDIISNIDIRETFKFKDQDLNKTWIVTPVLVMLSYLPQIKLDREHTEFRWIKPEEIIDFDCVPMIAKSLKKVI